MSTNRKCNTCNTNFKAAVARKSVLLIYFLILVPGLASAQNADRARQWGYVFVAPGRGSNVAILHFGGGGEGLVYKELAVGGEIGYFAPTKALNDGLAIISANASYHYLGSDPERKFVPFITGGYTLGFRGLAASSFNVGGGAQYWLSRKVGLRFELRDHALSRGKIEFFEIRFGVTFR